MRSASTFASTLVFAAAALFGTAAQAEDITVKLGVLTDMSSLYADNTGPGSVLAAKMAVQDFNPAAHGMKVEIVSADHHNKPDVGSNIARQWFDVDHVDAIRRRAEFRRGARGQRGDPGKEQGVPGLRRRHLRSDRPEMLTQYRALDLRHLDARQLDRQLGGEDRRRHLVLPHGRLRVRPCARARHHRGGAGQWRQYPRQRQPSAEQPGLLLVPAAGAAIEGQDHRPRQCRRRHHQRYQARRRVRHYCRRATLCRLAGLHRRRRGARFEDGARAGR